MVVVSEYTEGSSSLSTYDHHKYDVFLSFRGIDTRLSFTDHLHKALLDANISAFLDDDGIETGGDLAPELVYAIKTSRASIIILSKNYATSTWCLEELVLILEQRKICNHIVIPIYYHVHPSDIRKQQNSFGDAMAMHKQKMEAETDPYNRSHWAERIERWTKALIEVAALKGMDVYGRRETEFIEEFVKGIYRSLRISSRIPLPQLIGMEDSINCVTSWLRHPFSDTGDMLTISGMSGTGKTSLAKYVYGLYSHEFEAISFIEDITKRYGENFSGLLGLQKNLCDDISKSSSKQVVHNVSKYTLMIENAIARKRVFLVLDAIDCVDQLDALLGSKGFYPGSKIIITTKDPWLTESCALFKTNFKPKHEKHLLQGIHVDESPQLKSISLKARYIKPQSSKEGGAIMIPIDVVQRGSEIFSHTLYGYFVGEGLAYSTVNYHVRDMWKAHGIEDVLMNDQGSYFFKFNNETGLIDVMDNGPWMIDNVPLFLQRWEAGLDMLKPMHDKVPLWVKIFDIPIELWTEEGLNILASNLGNPLASDSLTTTRSKSAKGGAGYASALIEMSAMEEWPDEIQILVPKLNGSGNTFFRLRVEYMWKPHRCSHCKIFGHDNSACCHLLTKTISKHNPRTTIDSARQTQEAEKNSFHQVRRKLNKKGNLKKLAKRKLITRAKADHETSAVDEEGFRQVRFKPDDQKDKSGAQSSLITCEG